MRSVSDPPPKRETLNLRIKAGEWGLIDRAARASGKTRTEFILDAARRAAEQTLLEQALIRVGPEAFEAFLALLDAPPAANERLRRTMRTPPPRERE